MNIEDITPVNGRFFIEVLPEEVQTYEGLVHVSAPASPEKSNIGLIKALPLGYNGQGWLSVGRRVIFNKHSGTILTFDRFDPKATEYRLIKEEDIHALLKQ